MRMSFSWPSTSLPAWPCRREAIAAHHWISCSGLQEGLEVKPDSPSDSAAYTQMKNFYRFALMDLDTLNQTQKEEVAVLEQQFTLQKLMEGQLSDVNNQI